MNTVGKKESSANKIRCVVSVSMLTEGWDANTVTHILGVRAFGTQLLCEQVVGRGLRRQSYDLNEEGLFNVEYADVLGIPFDFAAKPVVSPPAKPRETIRVHAVKPDRDALEIIFPRVEGYRVELPEERLEAKFGPITSLNSRRSLSGQRSPKTGHHRRRRQPDARASRGHAPIDDPVLTSRVICSTTNSAIPAKSRSCISSGSSSASRASGSTAAILRCSGGTYPAQSVCR